MMKSSSSNELVKPVNVCCIPSSSSETVGAAVGATNDQGDGDDHGACSCFSFSMHHPTPTLYHHHSIANPTESICSMAVQSGPHGRYAIASRQIPAGAIIVQCLPLAHSILMPPGASLVEEDTSEEDEGKRRRCARCFFQDGDEDISGLRKKKFGRCSKCRVVYYCSRSCQVGAMYVLLYAFVILSSSVALT